MIFAFLLIFLTLVDYLSNINVLSDQPANIVKGLITVSVLYFVFRSKASKSLFLYASLILILVLKSFMHPSIDLAVSLRESFKLMVLPFWLLFAVNIKYKSMPILWFLLIISALTLLEIIPAGGEVYDLSIYEASANGFVGIFSNAHSSGLTYLALASIAFVEFTKSKSRWSLMLIVLFTVFSFYSYVRTAWLPLIALLFFTVFQISESKSRAYMLLLLSTLIIVLVFAAQSEVLLDRLLNRNKYVEATGIESLGSNRVLLWLTNLELIWSSGVWNIFWGLGRERAFIEMESALGFSKVSHNIILDVFVREGLTGLGIYLTASMELVLWVKRHLTKRMKLIFYFIFFSWFLFQGTSFFMFDIFLALYLAEGYKYKHELHLHNKFSR
jgi:hypothetical protein